MLKCPFECGYKTEDEYSISLHVETDHSELGLSPFATRDGESLSLARALQCEDDYTRQENQGLNEASHALALSKNAENHLEREATGEDDADTVYVECPQPGCGEYISLLELNDHLDIHASLDDFSASPTIARIMNSRSAHRSDPCHSLDFNKHATHRVKKQHMSTHSPAKSEQGPSLARTLSPSLHQSSRKSPKDHSPSLVQKQSVRLGVSSYNHVRVISLGTTRGSLHPCSHLSLLTRGLEERTRPVC